MPMGGGGGLSPPVPPGYTTDPDVDNIGDAILVLS